MSPGFHLTNWRAKTARRLEEITLDAVGLPDTLPVTYFFAANYVLTCVATRVLGYRQEGSTANYEVV
jgi:hypothetical protein